MTDFLSIDDANGAVNGTTVDVSSTNNVFSTLFAFSTDIGGGAGIGKRFNQDSYGTTTLLFEGKTVHVVIVADGHGEKFGKDISQMCVDIAIQYVSNHLSEVISDSIACLSCLFEHIQTEVSLHFNEGGTTFTILLINETDGIVTSGNVGDSAAIAVSPFENLCSSMKTSYFDFSVAQPLFGSSEEGMPLANILHLTKDHNPEDPSELALLRNTVMFDVREKLQGLLSPECKIRSETFSLLLPEHQAKIASMNDEERSNLIETDSFCCNVAFDTQRPVPNIPIFNEDGTPKIPQ